ncbi:MAG: hypothetical protein PHE93_05595 [Clostridia bacterium]|nr:hypothetical protein [Clostridia bacterium]
MDFKSWKDNNNSKQSESSNNKSDNATSKNNSNSQGFGKANPNISGEEKIKIEEKLNEYKGKSEDDLMKELFSTASKLKGEGKLKPSDMEEFYNKSKGFLNAEQLEKLRNLIKMLGV